MSHQNKKSVSQTGTDLDVLLLHIDQFLNDIGLVHATESIVEGNTSAFRSRRLGRSTRLKDVLQLFYSDGPRLSALTCEVTFSFPIDSIEFEDCDLGIDFALCKAVLSSFLSVAFCFSRARIRFEAFSASPEVDDSSDLSFSISSDEHFSEENIETLAEKGTIT